MFVAALNEADIQQLETLAGEIWREHYTPIIGSDQVEYMLAKFHSPEALRRDIARLDWRYYFIQHEQQAVGYIGYALQDKVLFLSKLYLHSNVRGQGFGRRAMDFVLQQAKHAKVEKVSLTVNKYNLNTILAYEKMGFEKEGDLFTEANIMHYKMVLKR